jgi:hypothetical protein
MMTMEKAQRIIEVVVVGSQRNCPMWRTVIALLIQSLPFLSAVALVWLERVSDSKMKKMAAVPAAT